MFYLIYNELGIISISYYNQCTGVMRNNYSYLFPYCFYHTFVKHFVTSILRKHNKNKIYIGFFIKITTVHSPQEPTLFAIGEMPSSSAVM